MQKIFRFASFEADRERYQLRRGSHSIKLERIPLELLFLLLEHAGRLVPREQMVAMLWGDDVFLDTERSINTAIRKVRKALGDNPHHPRFLETIVGKGYRFMAPLLPDSQHENEQETRTNMQSVVEGTNQDNAEIRLRDFSVEATSRVPILTCNVIVGNIDLGRIPLIEVELPADVNLPLKPEDRLLLKLHGVRVTLTAKAIQALHAFSISVLQSGLRTRTTDSLDMREATLERTRPANVDTNARQFTASAALAPSNNLEV